MCDFCEKPDDLTMCNDCIKDFVSGLSDADRAEMEREARKLFSGSDLEQALSILKAGRYHIN